MTALWAAVFLAAGPSPGESAEAARFGDWLFGRGDYYRAIGEYQRALYLDPGGPTADAIELRIARAYAAGGRPDGAADVLRGLVARGRDGAVRDEALFELGRVRFRAGRGEEAAAALASYAGIPDPAGGPGADRARLLLALALQRAGDGPGARLALDAIPAASPVAGHAAALRAATLEVDGAPRRSPLAAGILSAALPGLGHTYAGDPAAGVGALALNGLFVWATVDAFRARRYGLGALLAVGESIWYGGAIFGAVAEAQRFNRDSRRAAEARVEERFRWVVEVIPGGAAVGIRGPLGGPGRRG